MDNKDLIENKSKVIYELGADVTLEFSNGDSLRISKTAAAFHSLFFTEIFFGPTATTNFKVKNFDSETFKIFLDCLFGLKEYSVLDSLLIYPIAHEYQVKESLENCAKVLKPKAMDENVPIILNLALFYNNCEILGNAMDFIKTEVGVVGFMENEMYRDLLEPASMCRLIEDAKLNSFVWKIIVEWGENYLKKNSKETDLRSFFKEIGILSKLDLKHFESFQAVFDFHNETKLFESCQFFAYLNSRMINRKLKLPEKSDWIKSDEAFTETIEFVHPLGFSSDEHGEGLSFWIYTNKVFFDNFKHNKNPFLNVKCKYLFRSFSLLAQHQANCSVYRYGNNSGYLCGCSSIRKASAFGTSANFEKTVQISSGALGIFSADIQMMPDQFQEIQSFEITYGLKNVHNLKFLKTTLSGNYKADDKLYFTRDVFCLSKKADVTAVILKKTVL